MREPAAHAALRALHADLRIPVRQPHRPGLTLIPGPSRARATVELAYLFPSFNAGFPITPRFDQGDRRLAVEMKRRWGAFVRFGSPDAEGLARWPAFDLTQRVLSLRQGGQSTAISEQRLRHEHGCGFWDTLPAPMT